MSINKFKIEDIKDLDEINKFELDKNENIDKRGRFKLDKSDLDEFEQMHVKAMIKQEKEDKISGNYKYDSGDRNVIQKYRLSDEVKRRNRCVSTEIKLSISCITEDIGELDRKDKRIFDYTGYKLIIRKSDCKSKTTFKYIFNSFKEFYSKYFEGDFSLTTTRNGEDIQLSVNFLWWFALKGFKGIDNKMNEVKREIETILNSFEIYDYHVILEALA